MTVRQWSDFLDGKLEGGGDILITHPAKIEEAGDNSISFIAHPKYHQFAYSSHAAAIIVHQEAEFEHPVKAALIRVEEPYMAFARVLEKFNRPFDALTGIHALATVESNVSLGKDVFIGAYSVISSGAVIGDGVKIFPQVYIGEDVVIGEGTVLYPGCRVYRDCRIGSNCTLHSGVVIGSDGFGFAPQPDGAYMKIPQLGNVILEDNVEVGANSTIDRATLGSTILRKGVKLDNLVHVAHNVEIGEHTVIAAQSGISGSTRLGRHCQVGGQVGFVGHITIADGSRINAQSGVSKSIIENNKAVTGSPAFDYTASLRSQAVYRNLPELLRRVDELEQKLKEWEIINQALPVTK